MTRLKQNDAAFVKKLNIIAFVFGIVIPLVNNFALELLRSSIYGDVLYETEAGLLGGLVDSVSFISVYVLSALLINAYMRFGFDGGKKILLFSLCRCVIVYASEVAIQLLLTRNFKNSLADNLATVALNFAIEAGLFLVILGVSKYLRQSYAKLNNTDITLKRVFDLKNPLTSVHFWSALLIGAVYLASNIASSFSSDAPKEFLAAAYSYIRWAIRSVVGYFIMHLTAKYLEGLYAGKVVKTGKNK